MKTYQQAKQQLKNAADLIKKTRPSDKPAIREYINNVADSIVKDYINCPSWNISDAKREQYAEWLHLYACELHPKKQTCGAFKYVEQTLLGPNGLRIG